MAVSVLGQVTASDLQGSVEKLNKGVAFLIRYSQKLFKASAVVFSLMGLC